MIKNFLYLTVLTFAIIVVWVSLEIYRNFNPPIPAEGVIVDPIENSFDFETVERLKSRNPIPVDFSVSVISSTSARPEEDLTISNLLNTLNAEARASSSATISATNR